MRSGSMKRDSGAKAELPASTSTRTNGQLKRPIWIDRLTASELTLFACSCAVGTIIVLSQVLQF
ncbi:hypothetical protein HED55_13580 [Ochrobactrum haematophilum]|uniref:Uncharacterized protein n=1 Tax=Brucella haematophila TaxID=419474 RepID=A0ABX1DQU9_9HYPH|nr:hypothetical protein [Brucella haematophila]